MIGLFFLFKHSASLKSFMAVSCTENTVRGQNGNISLYLNSNNYILFVAVGRSSSVWLKYTTRKSATFWVLLQHLWEECKSERMLKEAYFTVILHVLKCLYYIRLFNNTLKKKGLSKLHDIHRAVNRLVSIIYYFIVLYLVDLG